MVQIHYSRNDKVLERGNIRVRGDVIEVHPAYEDECIRIELFGSEVDGINRFDPISGEVKEELNTVILFPAKHFVVEKETTLRVIDEIKDELNQRLDDLRKNNKLLEAQRLEQRTNFDIAVSYTHLTLPTT